MQKEISKQSPFDIIDRYSKSLSFMVTDELIKQYVSMANGGSGGRFESGEDVYTYRERCYEDQPDSFFQMICDGMKWDWRNSPQPSWDGWLRHMS